MTTVCIAGMHRSGTSMVAHLLHECGLYLGEPTDLIPPRAHDNPEGYWEHRAFVQINDAVKDIQAWFTRQRESRLDKPQVEPLRTQAQELISGFADQPFWGWKDPRNSLTLPFWAALLPDLRIVVCVRHPLEVALSLEHRAFNPMPLEQGFGLCGQYFSYLISHLQQLPAGRALVTRHDDYFRDPVAELRRVLAFLNHPVAEETLSAAVQTIRPNLRRNRAAAAAGRGVRVPHRLMEHYLTLLHMEVV